MASLTLTVGALTATVSASNTKAANLLTQYADAIGASGTNQDKADAVVVALGRHMTEVAQRQRTNAAKSEALVNLQAEIDALAWAD